MKYLIAGGSGLIGRALTDEITKAGHEVKWVSRRPKKGESWGWNAADLDEAFAWADGLVNLAGENVLGRWNGAKKKKIIESRVEGTRSLVDAIRRSPKKPVALVNASGIGYYGPGGDALVDEASPAGPPDDLLVKTCLDSEAEAAKAGPAGVRVCCIRIGMVLSPSGGALKKMLPLFKMGLGGPQGSGRQWVPWIHIQDLTGIILHLLSTAGSKGAFNLVSPNAVTNADFARCLGRILGRPSSLRVPEAVLRFLLGPAADMVLQGQRSAPKRVLESGYRFKFPDLDGALADLTTKQPKG